MPIRKMRFMCCVISRAMIRRSGSRRPSRRLTTSFRSRNSKERRFPTAKAIGKSPFLVDLISLCRDMASAASEDRSDSLSVPWIDAVRFVRQLSHDLRNHLNAIELQSAYVSELDASAELKGEIKRLREMIPGLTVILQKLARGL